MTRRMWFRRLVALVGAVTLGGLGLAAASSERPDCPGKIVCPMTGKLVCKDRCPARDANRPDCPGQIVCPQTGKLVCKDQCPARDANRPDCPGQIVCPLTGKLVCKDRCPLHGSGENNVAGSAEKPACCSKGKGGA